MVRRLLSPAELLRALRFGYNVASRFTNLLRQHGGDRALALVLFAEPPLQISYLRENVIAQLQLFLDQCRITDRQSFSGTLCIF